MNEQDIKSQVLSELGSPTVKIEVDDSAWASIIARSKRWFQSKKGVLSCAPITLVDGISSYDFPANALAILDVVLPLRSDIQSLLSLGFFDIVPLNAMNIGAVTSAFNSYSSYVQILQSLATRRRVFGAEPDWYIECNKIFLTTNSLTSGGTSGLCGTALVFFTKKVWEVSELLGRDEDMFYRWAKNELLYTLSRIRGKYKDYPAAGGMVSMDAAELMEEYTREKEILEQEISESQGPMSIVVG